MQITGVGCHETSDTIGLLNIDTRDKYRLFLHTRAGSEVMPNFRKKTVSTISPIQNSLPKI